MPQWKLQPIEWRLFHGKKRDVAHGGVYKHPLVQGNGGVFLGQSFEYGQVDRETDLGDEA